MVATMKKAGVLAQVEIKPKGQVDVRPIREISGKAVPTAAKAILEEAQLKLEGKANSKTYYKVGTLSGKEGLFLRIKVKDKHYADYQLLRRWDPGEAGGDGGATEKALKDWVTNRKTVLSLLETGAKTFKKKAEEAEAALDRIEGVAEGYSQSSSFSTAGDGKRDGQLKVAKAELVKIEKLAKSLKTHHDRTYFPQYQRTFREGRARKEEAGLTDRQTKPYSTQMNDSLRHYNSIKDSLNRVASIVIEGSNSCQEAEAYLRDGTGALEGLRLLAKKAADLAVKENDAIDKAWGLEDQRDFLRQLLGTFTRVKSTKDRLDAADPGAKAPLETAFDGYVDAAAIKMQKIEDAIKASSAHAKRILTAEAKFVKKIPRDSRGDEAIVQRLEVYEEIKTSIVAKLKSWQSDITKARKAFKKVIALKAG